jgi:phosphatidyl-myo-inositol dimannoside synthase
LRRILFVTDKFMPQRGGTQVIFDRIYRELSLQGQDQVTVLTREFGGAAEYDRTCPFRVHRVPFVDVPKLRMPWLWLTLGRAARQLTGNEAFTEIHAGQCPETAWVARSVARQLAVPYLVHTFAEEIQRYSRIARPLVRVTLQDAYAVTTISQYTRARLRELGVRAERIQLMYPGVDPTRTSEEELKRLRLRHGITSGPVLLTVCRLIRRKGVDRVLSALPALLRRHPDLVYLIVGGGREERRLRRLAEELGVMPHVRFIGSVPPSETPAYYDLCDLFVMPNYELPNGDVEGFGIVFLEANARCKPVVGGCSGGTQDAILDGETGRLVDGNDIRGLTDVLSDLLANPDQCRNLGEQGRERVHREFTWESTSRQFEAAMARRSLLLPATR